MYAKALRRTAIAIAALFLTGSITACSHADSTSTTDTGSESNNVQQEINFNSLAEEDTDASYDTDKVTKITLNGTNAAISGNGASVSAGSVVIASAGTYLLEGTLTNGQILILTDKTATVRLILNGTSITSTNSAAINGQQAGKIIVTLADGTENALCDGTGYDSGEDAPSGTLYAKNDLTINGTGSLTVTGNCNNGIAAKDNLVITGGTIQVTAVGNGIRGKDSLTITDGDLTVDAQEDGIKSANDTDVSKGWVHIAGGTINVTSGEDGIQAETALLLEGGTLNITSGGGSENGTSQRTQQGGFPGWSNGNTSASDSVSAKALKAGSSLTMTGGTATIDSADDSVHCNGDVTISAGSLSLTSGDDGVHADSTLTISDGNLTITKSYEGLEGQAIVISGGTMDVTSSDDGLNAAGGSDSSSTNGRPGQNMFASEEGVSIEISGGTVLVNAGGDGVDSNGDLTFSGGTVLVSGPTDNGNAALDSNGTMTVNGGTLVAAGSSGMAENPSAGTQSCAAFYFSQSQQANTPVHLLAEDGTVLLSLTPQKQYNYVIFSCSALADGMTVSVATGGTLSGGTGANGLTTGGTVSGATILQTFSLSSVTTSYSESGAVSGGMGQMGGGFGGGKGQR